MVALAIGLLAGGLSGLFGVGGGILIVPALTLIARMDQRLAHGTSLAATAPVSLAGMLGYAANGEVDWVIVVLLLSGSLVGAWIGASWLKGLSTRWLKYGFAAMLVLTALRMLLTGGEGTGRGDIDLVAGLGFSLLGLFTGALAGLMGVGGGIIMVPAMIMLFSMPTVLAKGTSLAVIVPTALLGTAKNRRNQNVDLRTAVGVGAAGVVSSFLASQVSLGLDPRLSAILFAALLITTAIRMVIRANPVGKADG